MMKRFEYEHKRYHVQAKRKGATEDWTEWTAVDDYDEAVKHRDRAEEAGFDARIIDKGERQ